MWYYNICVMVSRRRDLSLTVLEKFQNCDTDLFCCSAMTKLLLTRWLRIEKWWPTLTWWKQGKIWRRREETTPWSTRRWWSSTPASPTSSAPSLPRSPRRTTSRELLSGPLNLAQISIIYFHELFLFTLLDFIKTHKICESVELSFSIYNKEMIIIQFLIPPQLGFLIRKQAHIMPHTYIERKGFRRL